MREQCGESAFRRWVSSDRLTLLEFANTLGDLLVSTGDDGLVQVWKRGINHQWLKYAEVDATKEN